MSAMIRRLRSNVPGVEPPFPKRVPGHVCGPSATGEDLGATATVGAHGVVDQRCQRAAVVDT